jgi:RNA polymerase sigma-70 factor (family 1)
MDTSSAGSVCEEDNFKTLYRSNAKPLRNFIYYRCGDLEKAEDIVQEAMISLWENCLKVVFGKAKSFLFKTAGNLMIDQIRHEKVKLNFLKQVRVERAEDPLFNVLKAEFEQQLETAISNLPSTQREAFLMSRIDKMSYEEIAGTLDISVKAVEKRMHLALTALKENVRELKYLKF